MHAQVNENAFIQAFVAFDRVANFELDGLQALFSYLEELETEAGEQYALDVIALCCDFQRFESIQDYNAQYGTEYTSADDVEEIACTINASAFICHAH